MTIVEFFDKDAIENIVSTLLCEPDKVIFVGSNKNEMERAVGNYRRIAENGNIQVEFECQSVNRNDLPAIVRALTAIVEQHGTCTFDLTGGEELYLVAVGVVFQQYRDKIQLHRFNVRNGQLYDCDADSNVEQTLRESISCEELIGAFGGRIVYADEKPTGTYEWSFTDDFVEDIWAMWRLCFRDVAAWNTQINALDGMTAWLQTEPADLSLFVDKLQAAEALPRRGKTCVFLQNVLKPLEEQGLITDLDMKGETLSLTFKNEQVKRCLTKAGQILELLVTLLAMNEQNDLGEPLYDDVMTGVVIDWDGQPATRLQEVENEIDVLLMKGLMPIFVSCKNGAVRTEELYKLQTVANRFGGKYAKKILIASDLSRFDNADDLRARAEEMNIRLITGVSDMTERQLQRTAQTLWCPPY